MANLKINLRIAEKWNSLPDAWKSVKKAKKSDIKYNLTDKNLISLFEPFFNDDGLRTAMSGLNVDNSSLVATDAHKLIHLKNVGGIEDGTYLISPKIAKKIKNPIGKLNVKFPDWKVIIHTTTDKVFNVDVVKLKTYCEAIKKGKYVNESTNLVTFMIGSENKTIQTMSFNVDYIIDTLNVFLKLGNKYIYAGYNSPNYSMYFSPDSYAASNPKNNIGGANFILVMPSMGEYDDPTFVGAKNVDYNTEIRVYYSFEDDQIHNADGSIAKFDYELNSNYLPYMNDYEFDLLKRVAGNSASTQILDNVCIKNNEAFASDWTQSIGIYGIYVEDGIYEIVSGALKDTEYKVSDFPMQMQKYMYFLEGTLDTMYLHNYVQEAKNYVIDDDKRPTLQGIGYVTDGDNKLTINGTNAYILFSKKLDNERPIKINNVLKNPEMQEIVFRGMDKFVNIYSSENGNFFKFASSTISYITESSSVPPNYKDVIPNETNSVLALNKDVILEEVKKLKGEEAKNNIIFKFDKTIKNKDEASGLLTIFTTKLVNASNKKYEADREILSIQYDIFKYVSEWDDNVALLMQQPNFENNELEFKANDLEVFLSTEHKGINLYFNSNKSSKIFVMPLLGGFGKYSTSSQQKSSAALPTPVSTPKFEVKVGDTFYDTQSPQQIYIVSHIKGDTVLVEWLKDNKQNDTLYDFYVLNSAFNDGRYILKYRDVDREAFLRPTPNFKEGDKFKDVNGEIYLINQIPQNSNYNVEVIEKNNNDKIEISIHNVNNLIDDGTWVLVEPNLPQINDVQVGDTFYHKDDPHKFYIISDIIDNTSISNNLVEVSWSSGKKPKTTNYTLSESISNFENGTWVLIRKGVDVDEFLEIKLNFAVGDKLRNTTTNEIVTVEFIPSAYDEWVRLKDENGASKYYGDKTEMLDWINDGLWVKEEPSLATRESIESIIRMYELKAKRGDTAADSIIKMYQIKLKRL